ncbi:chaperonin 10-like protein [Fimicolochytrium jonesii]|uniref:chaperonin 10-like protein n=1 Tax=Fimicolochytrium jonesii TaxID=1396493 RepID=UPI0022FED9DB|nr:chaperonin 10-like protein [Fimicolochytrium jonesii]KAI8817669.1 chaperonin 10-like protein [Fimicolochytrium jonesii]
MNALASLIDKTLKTPSGLDTTSGANPSNNPDLLADPSGEKMKALIWHAKNDVRVGEALKPKLVDDHDIILRITGSTVCGSDMHLLHGAILEMQSGDILGHEGMGVVEAVGSAVTKLKVGDRVVAGFNVACGTCFMCRQKLSSACVRTNDSALMNSMYGHRSCGMLGYSHFTGGFAGCQSEYTRIPHGDANCIKVPDSVPDEEALYISDILVTSFHQVSDAGVKENDIVGIWGCGAIGIMGAVWSAIRGAKHIIVIDNVQWRLDHVVKVIKRDYPTVRIESINFDEHKGVQARIVELTKPGVDGRDPTRPAGLDVALECAAGEYAKGFAHKAEIALGLETDSSENLNEMITSTISYGTVALTGVYGGFTNHLNIGSLMQRGIRFIGNGQCPTHKYMQHVMDEYIVTGKVKPTQLFVSHRINIDDIAKAYYKFDNHDSDLKIIKPFVATRFSNPPSPGAPQLTVL